jgi:hypothetical protein
MRPLWLQLGVTTDVGSYGSRIGARLSGTTRGQIRFSDNGDHIESAYEIRVYVHAILFCPESRSREAIPSKIELICPTTRANHLLLVGRAQAVAIATSKGGRADVVAVYLRLKTARSGHHSFLYPDPSIGPVSPPITDPKSSLWSPLNRYLYIRLRWSVGLVDLYAGSSDPGSSADAHDLKEAEAKTLLDSLQRWCVRVTKVRRNFVSCDDLRENGLCPRGTAALVVIDTRRNGVDCLDPPSAAGLEQSRMANEGTH